MAQDRSHFLYASIKCAAYGLNPVERYGVRVLSLLRKAAKYTRLIGPVHFGNEAAAWSRAAWFTHLLCLGEELSRPDNLRDDVIFRKIAMPEGVGLPLDDKSLKEAVEWMRRVWSAQDAPPKKIYRKHLLVYSRSVAYYGLFKTVLSCPCRLCEQAISSSG